MRFNEKELVAIAQRPGDINGRLQYTQIKGPPGSSKNAGFRDRFFKLVGNLLFYFRFNDVGAVDYKEPVGVLVLENYSVQPELDVDLGNFAFGILFLDDYNDCKRHVFAARTDNDVQLWINKLQTASYQHWNNQLALKRNLLKALRESRQPENSAPISQGNIIPSPTFTTEPEPPLISLDINQSISAPTRNSQPTIPPRRSATLPPPQSISSRQRPATSANKNEEDLMKF